MAHFAQLNENNVVINVIVVNNEDILDDAGQESEEVGVQFCENLLGGKWIQTSYNGNFRKRYASIDGSYDYVNDVFIAPKTFDSWVLNDDFEWVAPVPYPEDGVDYAWDEDNMQWIAIPVS